MHLDPGRKPAKRRQKVILLNCSGLKGWVKRSEIRSTLSYTIRISHWGVSRLLADIPTYSIFFLCFNIYYIVPQHEIVPLFNCRTMVLASFVAFDLVSRPPLFRVGKSATCDRQQVWLNLALENSNTSCLSEIARSFIFYQQQSHPRSSHRPRHQWPWPYSLRLKNCLQGLWI